MLFVSDARKAGTYSQEPRGIVGTEVPLSGYSQGLKRLFENDSS